MKIQNYVAVILGIGLASLAILSSLLQQGVFATAYGEDSSPDIIANPSGFNVTDGNLTGGGNITGAQEGIPTANTTGANIEQHKDNPQ
jgi:hypothetical protein